MEVDHVLPEKLLNDESLLKDVLKNFGLPDDFQINSYANWLPACRSCNQAKKDAIFSPAPIFVGWLRRAQEKAAEVEAFEKKCLSDKEVARILNAVERAFDIRSADLLAISELGKASSRLVEYTSKIPDSLDVGSIFQIIPRFRNYVTTTTDYEKEGRRSIHKLVSPFGDFTIAVDVDGQVDISYKPGLKADIDVMLRDVGFIDSLSEMVPNLSIADLPSSSFTDGTIDGQATSSRQLPTVIYGDPLKSGAPARRSPNRRR